MSTFKKPPKYCEFLLNCLAYCRHSDCIGTRDVLSAVEWEFEGGRFGEVPEALRNHEGVYNETCEREIPWGSTRELLDLMPEVDRDLEVLETADKLPRGLGPVVRRRIENSTIRKRDALMYLAPIDHAAVDNLSIVTGMRAVYRITHEMTSMVRSGELVGSQRDSKVLQLWQTLMVGGAPSAKLHLPTMRKNAAASSLAMKKSRLGSWLRLVRAVEEIERTMVSRVRRKCCREFLERQMDLNTVLGDDGAEEAAEFVDSRKIGTLKLTCYVNAVAITRGSRMYLCSRSDWHKVLQLVRGQMNVIVAACTALVHANRKNFMDVVNSVSQADDNMSRTIACMCACPQTVLLPAAKYMKDVMAVMKAELAGPINAEGKAQLRAKMSESPAEPYLGKLADEMLVSSKALSATGRYTALGVYRILPPPDVSQAEAMLRRWEKVCFDNNCGEDACAKFEDELENVICDALMRMPSGPLELRDPKQKPRWIKHVYAREYDQIPVAEIKRYYKWEGCMKKEERSRYNPACWKDSGLGPDRLTDMDDPKRPDYMSSMIMRMAMDPACPMPDALEDAPEHVCDTILKPESHKARIAYSANIRDRQLQSQTEDMVEAVARHHTAFSIVKTGSERVDKTDLMTDVAQSGICQIAYFSFDVSGWSENMPGDLQETSHKVWDKVYDTDLFARTTACHKHAVVACDSDGYHVWYRNGTANFEGFNGKELTMLHITLMVIALKELRDECDPDLSRHITAILQAYIDDGVARLELPREQFHDTFRKFREKVVAVWSRYGLTIDVAKSFPSDRFYEYLNEGYLAGRHVSNGVKAAMRIGTELPEKHETAVEQVAKVTAAARGATISGLPALAAYSMQGFFLAEWAISLSGTKKMSVVRLATWLYLPTAAGGMGVPGPLQMATNAGGAATEEGFELLRLWSRENLMVRQMYAGVMRRTAVTRDAGSILASPLGLDLGKSRASTVMPAIKRTFAERGRTFSPLAETVARALDEKASDEFARSLVATGAKNVYQEQVLDEARKATPQEVAMQFIRQFDKERSIRMILGNRAMRFVVKEARSSARQSLMQMMTV